MPLKISENPGMKFQVIACVWNKILLKEHENSVANNLRSIIVETVQTAHDVGFDDLISEDVEEITNLHDAGFSNEDLIEIEKESYRNPEIEDDECVEQPKKLTKKILQENLEIIAQALNVLTENDPDFERACFIRRGVTNNLTPYTELLKEERSTRQQSTLDRARNRIYWHNRIKNFIISLHISEVFKHFILISKKSIYY